MRYFTLVFICIFFSCSTENSITDKPTPNNNANVAKSILDKDIDIDTAIKNGDLLMQKQVTVSKFDSEVYAHDSKLIIDKGIGYCAYYGNDLKSGEAEKGQSVRLSVFNIKNPSERKVFDVFKENFNYKTLVTDPNLPCYTPVLFLTDEGKIRILSKVYEKNVQKYYYRDFSPDTETFSDPQICKLAIANSKELVDFDIFNVKSHLKYLFGNDYQLKSDYMFATSEPIKIENGSMIGLTVGIFTADWKADQGTTILLKTFDFGKTFECSGAPDSRKIDPKYSSQCVEGAFSFITGNDMIMIGRNSLGGIVECYSHDGGETFNIPISLNEYCGFNARATKPNLMKIKGGYLTMWNINESFGDYTDRTILDVRYSKDENMCNSKLKIRIKNAFGCHYPSLFVYNEEYYLTYTTDSRRFNKKSTGEIVFVKLDL
ncbi:sialidase family protein [Flavobacterium sp. LC2016-01]|uniref:sialidase family protein n=1 Tax=Flavobacterium sp. LC2016-01 TaxID=2675876 RepID=UPI0012BA98F7|nr:sialidase family protein [Flavobacterium sp. LC2016-01]MTH18085.1 hypothetical protein [Flavobacterium sp. LC2016-01]